MRNKCDGQSDVRFRLASAERGAIFGLSEHGLRPSSIDMLPEVAGVKFSHSESGPVLKLVES